MKIYHCFPKGKYKALTMSYDDGYSEDERLLDIFNRYGVKATFNLNSGLFQETYNGHIRIPKEKIAELYKGHEVATHSYTHPTLARCPLVQIAEEILQDRKELEMITGGLVRGHAYPNGSYNEEIKALLEKLGIAYGRVAATKADFTLPRDRMEWYPTCHHNDSKLMELANFFVNFKEKWCMKLMYVWGHSYEFSDDNNWEVIEEFCARVGNRDDIWYATNIEIIDYMEVLERLQFAASGQGVFNPSSQSAWLEIDNERVVEVPAGKYVDLREKG